MNLLFLTDAQGDGWTLAALAARSNNVKLFTREAPSTGMDSLGREHVSSWRDMLNWADGIICDNIKWSSRYDVLSSLAVPLLGAGESLQLLDKKVGDLCWRGNINTVRNSIRGEVGSVWGMFVGGRWASPFLSGGGKVSLRSTQAGVALLSPLANLLGSMQYNGPFQVKWRRIKASYFLVDIDPNLGYSGIVRLILRNGVKMEDLMTSVFLGSLPDGVTFPQANLLRRIQYALGL